MRVSCPPRGTQDHSLAAAAIEISVCLDSSTEMHGQYQDAPQESCQVVQDGRRLGTSPWPPHSLQRHARRYVFLRWRGRVDSPSQGWLRRLSRAEPISSGTQRPRRVPPPAGRLQASGPSSESVPTSAEFAVSSCETLRQPTRNPIEVSIEYSVQASVKAKQQIATNCELNSVGPRLSLLNEKVGLTAGVTLSNY